MLNNTTNELIRPTNGNSPTTHDSKQHNVDQEKPQTTFAELDLDNKILDGVTDVGYTSPTPIQAKGIPVALAKRDILATAQTGSGKTAAFVLPILQLLQENQARPKGRNPKALILSPVRELANQIAKNVEEYGSYLNFNQVTIYGGVSQRPQVKQLRRGVDVVIATPGRLLDLINQRKISLQDIEMFVLDEADRMLDMGFIDDIRKLMKYMTDYRQVLLYSATMPDEIIEFADEIQHKPIRIEVDAPATTVDTVNSTVLFVQKSDKFSLLLNLMNTQEMDKVLIFVKTKRSVNKIYKKLKGENFNVALIHGDKSQNQREAALYAFRQGKVDILVGTDVASRGIDVDDITHVINYDMSSEPEAYVHRIGRTARAGRLGKAYNFCDNQKERNYLERIEELTGEKIPEEESYPFKSRLRRKDGKNYDKPKSKNKSKSNHRSNKSRKNKKQYHRKN